MSAENRGLLFFGLLTGLFLAFSFKFGLGDWIYPIDWAERVLIILILIAYAYWRGEFILTRPRQVPIPTQVLYWGAGILLCLGIYAASSKLSDVWEAGTWHQFPAYANDFMYWTDVTLGIALVAISEELAFRWLPGLLAQRHGWSWTKLHWISALGFMLIHIPQGMNTMLFSVVFSIFLMMAYKRYGTLLAPIFIHFAYDALAFAGTFHWIFGF